MTTVSSESRKKYMREYKKKHYDANKKSMNRKNRAYYYQKKYGWSLEALHRYGDFLPHVAKAKDALDKLREASPELLAEFLEDYMAILNATNTIEPVRLPEDCWSDVLSFLPTIDRFQVAPTNKEIYTSLKNSFTGQTIDLTHTGVTDAGLAHLSHVKEIVLWGCDEVTDAGLAHLLNVKVINLWDCQEVTDTGLAHLSNVENINLCQCENITDAGLAHLSNVTKIDLSHCENITDAGLAHLSNVKFILLST
jgi:hypothetical protein